MSASPDQQEPMREQSDHVPWYSREVRLNKWVKALLLVAGVIALCATTSVRPLWQFCWRHQLYNRDDFSAQRTTARRTVPGGAWRHSRVIRVYAMPGIRDKAVEEATDGLRSLVRELGLDISVQRTTPSPDALRSYQYALVHSPGKLESFDYDRFAKSRLALRGGQYGEMVIVDPPFTDPPWAFGLASFAPGLAVLQQSVSSTAIARHEGAHLLGYCMHDDDPLFVIGYREGMIPSGRNTLMMLNPMPSTALSGRARDALHAFWLGLETRDHQRYFRR